MKSVVAASVLKHDCHYDDFCTYFVLNSKILRVTPPTQDLPYRLNAVSEPPTVDHDFHANSNRCAAASADLLVLCLETSLPSGQSGVI